jgi:hypothetical protein
VKITIETHEGPKEYTVEELDQHAHAILHSDLGPAAEGVAKGLANCVLALCEVLTKAGHFKDTWPAWQGIDTSSIDTDLVRYGWPKPTIYREHETIHILLNEIDNLRTRLAQAQAGS